MIVSKISDDDGYHRVTLSRIFNVDAGDVVMTCDGREFVVVRAHGLELTLRELLPRERAWRWLRRIVRDVRVWWGLS